MANSIWEKHIKTKWVLTFNIKKSLFLYWDESMKISREYVFFIYRSMRNHSQSLTLEFVNSIWEEHIKMERVLTFNIKKIYFYIETNLWRSHVNMFFFIYRSMRNHSQSLTLEFLNSIWDEHIKTERVLTFNIND